jgi:Concanavalin A-like lectin/glucanases superfamily
MRSFGVISGENALSQQFTNLRADARGSSFLLAQQMLGYFTLSTNPANGKTLTLDINGTNVVFTFVTSIGSTAGNVLIGASAAATVANLLALLNQPQTTTATGVALAAANQTLVTYLSYAVPTGGTTLYILTNNTNLYAPLTSFSGSTNATSDSFTSQTMQLYVHAGTVYVNGTRVLWAGGSTSTVTAPSSHPRIDVLTIDNTGTLAWTTGIENASPTAPTYPADKAAICELYNVVSETILNDYDNQTGSQGYISNDVRPFLGQNANWGAFQDSIIPSAADTYNLGSGSFEWLGVYASNFYIGGVAIKTLTAGYTAGAAITAGQPIYFDWDSHSIALASASSQYLSSTGANLQITSSFTIEAWINLTSTPGSNAGYAIGGDFYFDGSHSARGWSFELFNTSGTMQLMLRLCNTSNAETDAVVNWSPSTSTWYHVAAVYNASAGSVAFYVNGVQQGSTQTGMPTSLSYNNVNNTFYIGGKYNSGVVDYFNGDIDAVRVWSTNQSGSTISGNYNLLLSGAETNLVGYWTFNGVLTDRTSNGYTLSNPNSASYSTSTGGLTGQYIFPTSASQSDTATTFLGIALSTVSALQNVTVQYAGVVAGLSGLSGGAQYYLGNSTGTFSTSPGTVTRKAAIALTSTSLVITNIW